LAESAFSRIFLNRSEEKKFFESQLQYLVDRPSMPKRILNYWGVGGIGKTALLKLRFKEIVKKQPFGRNWYFAYLDFEQFPENNQPITSFSNCLTALEKALTESGLELENDQEKTDEARAKSLTSQLQARLASNYLVLVFDGLTQARNWFSKLEQYFLSPLLSQVKNILLLVGSRSPIRFERFELRMQLQLYQLLPLAQTQDEKLIANLLQTLHHKFPAVPGDSEELYQVAEKLQNLSNGHPQTLVYILDEKLPADLAQALEVLKSSEKENQLKIDLLNYVLTRYATIPNLSDLAANQLRFAIREIASYNRFDLKLLELALIWAVEPEVRLFFEAKLHNAPFFSELIKSMLNTRMIEWETMQRGYVLDSTYREIILNGLAAEAPEVFRQRHQNAVRHYLTILNSKQGDEETRAMYVCEILYHLSKAFADDTTALKGWLLALDYYLENATWPHETPYQPIAPEAISIIDNNSNNRSAVPPSRWVIANLFSTYSPYHKEILELIQKVNGLNFDWLILN
jgi:hypothetical protein